MSPSRLFLALLLLAGISTAHAETALRVSEANHYMGDMPTYAAIDGGMFARHGISVTVITMKGGPIAANALMSGDVDFMGGSADQAVKMLGKGQQLRIVGSLMQHQSYAVVVPNNSAIQTAQDLKGKVIGVTAVGSASDVATRAWLVGQGIDPQTDLRVVGLGGAPTVVAAFEHGQVQAATSSPPSLTRLLQTGHVIFDTRTQPYQEGSIIIRAADLTGPRAEIMHNVVQAIIEAEDKLHKDDEFALEVGRKEFPEIPADALPQLMQETIHKYDAIAHGAVVTPDSYNNVVTNLMRINAIDHPVPFADAVDERFLK